MCILGSIKRVDIPKQRGVSLVELVMFIVIVSVALVGTLQVMNHTTRSSADPFVRKQALAVAESLLEEVALMPFTFCDPDDSLAATATSAAECTIVESIGPEAGETRFGALPFDNVNDYHGFSMNGISDITNTPITGLESFNATITVVAAALGGIPATDSLLITVTVTGLNAEPVVQQGYRTRFSPRTTP